MSETPIYDAVVREYGDPTSPTIVNKPSPDQLKTMRKLASKRTSKARV